MFIEEIMFVYGLGESSLESVSVESCCSGSGFVRANSVFWLGMVRRIIEEVKRNVRRSAVRTRQSARIRDLE